MDIFGGYKKYVKTLIKDTIETYSGQWRLIHEPVQNSSDSIQRNSNVDTGHIGIKLYVGSNKVEVIDNGQGIPSDKVDTLYTLGGTDKNEESLKKILKGSQGVGIKATVFTSTNFEVETVNNNQKWNVKIEDAWRFNSADFNSKVKEPKKEDCYDQTGTKLTYSIHDYSVNDFLNEICKSYYDEFENQFNKGENIELNTVFNEEDFIKIIELYFRTETYLACVQTLMNEGKHDNKHKPINVSIDIIFDHSNIQEHKENNIFGCEFLKDTKYHLSKISHTFPAKYMDFELVHRDLKKDLKVDNLYQNFTEVLARKTDINSKKLYIQKISADQAKYLLGKVTKDKNTTEGRIDRNEDKEKKHRNLLDKLNGIYIVIGKRNYLAKYLNLSPKQLISVNGLATNISLNAPKGAGELGYLLNIHFVMDIDTTLGYGKRNIPAVVKGQVDSYFADIFPILRRIAKEIVGERDEGGSGKGEPIDKELQYTRYMEISNFLKNRNLPFRTIPETEQDVVCLFNQLIREELKGYYVFRSDTGSTYDSLMYMSTSHLDMPEVITWRDLKNVEFKHKLSSLIKDFIGKKKFIEELELVIVWEDDIEEESEYTISSLERDGIEAYPGAQKRIRHGTNSCQVLVLKDFLINRV